jgi:hypothetical protein
MNTSVEGLSLVTVIALIRKEIAESRAVGKAGNDGKQGAKGDRGPKGDSGPAGRQGPKGNDGKQGKPGKDGTVGEDGADGVGIQDIEQDIDGAIVVTMTDGETYTLELPAGSETTQVHYKVGGSSGGGESGSVDLSNYVQKPASNASWMVYKKEAGWSPVTTDLIATNSDVVFRDAKGRFKSTENIPELSNQLEVNRWFLEQLESIESGEIDLPDMTNEATPNTLVLRDSSSSAKFNSITGKKIYFTETGSSNTADTWFLSGGEASAYSVRKNDAEGMRASLNVYSKGEVDALSGGDSFFTDIGSNTIEYFGDQLWVTSLRDPFFIGAKIGSDSEFTGTVTANKFVGDGSQLTGLTRTSDPSAPVTVMLKASHQKDMNPATRKFVFVDPNYMGPGNPGAVNRPDQAGVIRYECSDSDWFKDYNVTGFGYIRVRDQSHGDVLYFDGNVKSAKKEGNTLEFTLEDIFGRNVAVGEGDSFHIELFGCLEDYS